MEYTGINALQECLNQIRRLEQMMAEDKSLYEECMGGELLKVYTAAVEAAEALLKKSDAQVTKLKVIELQSGDF